MDSEIIKAWKENERPFGLVTVQMKEKARLLSYLDFEHYDYKGVWRKNKYEDTFDDLTVYRLLQDYEPEIEVLRYKIKVDPSDGFLFYDYGIKRRLSFAIEDEAFIGFENEGWLWGCLYELINDDSIVETMIPAKDIDLYRVITLGNGYVLFRSKK